MASAIIANLQEEVTCPICLELLREPLSLNCGHSFCQACITVNNKTSMISSEGESTCPMCRISYQPDNIRPNQHLANIVEKLREVKVSLKEEQKRDVCNRHGEKLLLFCKEDGNVICWLCERSQEHHGHHTFLVEEVVQENQAKLKTALERLRMMQKEAEKLGAEIREERASCKAQKQSERQNVQAQFSQLRDILDSEEQSELQKLQEDEENVMYNLKNDERELAQKSQLVAELISDLERRLQASSIEMLQDVNNIIKRSEICAVKRTKTIPKKQSRVFQAPDLKEMLQVFRELTDARCYWVHLRLDPMMPNAVTISKDQRQMKLVSNWIRINHLPTTVCNSYGVLGLPYLLYLSTHNASSPPLFLSRSMHPLSPDDSSSPPGESSAMASVQANIEKEVTCPICLELLTKPLSLDCGHSFCQACITAKNVELQTVISPGGQKSCPVCHASYQPGNLWPNQHLAKIVNGFREAKLSPQEGQKSDRCVHHGEKLLFFCKNDEKVICLCVRSQEHCGHQTFLVEEVVKECQEKLQETLTRLRKEQQEAEKLEAQIIEERASCKHQTQTERQRILAGFNDLHAILDNDKKRELQKLEEEEVNVLDNLAEVKYQLIQQYQDLSDLISDVEHRMQWSSVDMIWGSIFVIPRSESWTLKKPKIVSKKLKNVCRVPDLKEILQVFRELTDVRCYWVRMDVTLNQVNTSSNVVISADQRQVAVLHIPNFRNSDQRDFSAFDVLGCQYFSSGKHYWEVDVSRKTAWILGVYCRAKDSHERWASGFVFGLNVNSQNVYSRYRPQYGYWVIGLQNQFEHNAFEKSSTSNPQVLTLFMAVPPHRIGVFLDYEAGTVSFFNVTNQGSLIYKFSQCCFSQCVCPYFNPCKCPAPMTLCPPSS
ncbi:LOW QUALITY PROTEIN: E3 ubiquitin-protein ligase TRIM22-like [Dugong dugon]